MPHSVRLRVLVVEDEWVLASTIADILRAAGYDVVGPAGRFNDAMRLAENEEFDAAVLDLNLRGQLSIPVAHVLRDRNRPFLFLTGYDASNLPKEFGDAPLLEKPFTSAELTDCFDQLLAERHAPGT